MKYSKGSSETFSTPVSSPYSIPRSLEDEIEEFRNRTKKSLKQMSRDTGLSYIDIVKWSKGVIPNNTADYGTMRYYLKGIRISRTIIQKEPPADVKKEASPHMEGAPVSAPSARKVDLAELINSYCDHTRKTKKELAKETGFSYANICKYGQGTRPRNHLDEKKLIAYLTEHSPTMEEKNVPSAQPILIIDVPAGEKPKFPSIQSVLGEFGETNGVAEVKGEAMEPEFKRGSRVILFQLKEPTLLVWGEYYYVLDTNMQGMVRRVQPGSTKSCITLVADNQDKEKYPTIERGWEEIESIYTIVATIFRY